jgi:hypothetical protein
MSFDPCDGRGELAVSRVRHWPESAHGDVDVALRAARVGPIAQASLMVAVSFKISKQRQKLAARHVFISSTSNSASLVQTSRP